MSQAAVEESAHFPRRPAGRSWKGRLLSAHPLAFLGTAVRHRRLIRRLAWRTIESRYRGSALGLLWTLIHPLLMLGVYTFVFSVVFRVRWDVAEGGEVRFALLLFSGLLLYGVFSECVNGAPHLMRDNRTYITQVLFPSEVLAWSSLLAALFNLAVGLGILGGFYIWTIGPPPATWLYLPLVLVPLSLLTLGAVWILSSLGVFLEDISQAVPVFTTGLLFLSPIFYPPSRIPEALAPYYLANPFAHILEASKSLIFYGVVPDLVALGWITFGAWMLAWGGYLWFRKTQASFADVL